MPAKRLALWTYYLTGVTTFRACAGTFVQVDASAADVTVVMPRADIAQPGDWLIVKKTDSSSHVVNIARQGSTDLINGSASSNVVSGQNQGRKIFPVFDADYGGAIGWVTF